MEILQKDNPKLREVSQPVSLGEIGSERINALISDMKAAMHNENDSVGIAAIQIGVPLRIFIVSGIVFAEYTEDADGNEVPKKPLPDDLVFINPKITKLSSKKEWVEEGCLSVRWKYGLVERAQKATVRAYDEHGAEFTRGASGLLAQIFQHEVDHLDGILFVDKAENIRDLPPREHEERQ